VTEVTSHSISPTFWIQILSKNKIKFIKSCSSRSFQEHQRHIPLPPKFSATNLIYFFSEEIIQYSRTFAWQVQMSWNQAHCTRPHRELSEDNTKNMIWSIPVGWIS
jgi:hypothetical protein